MTEWFGVKEKLPENDHPVAVIDNGKVTAGLYDAKMGFWFICSKMSYISLKVTYWTTLPERNIE